jgi:hypothetical protein
VEATLLDVPSFHVAAVFIPAVDPSDSNGGDEGFIRPAYAWEPPGRNREGAYPLRFPIDSQWAKAAWPGAEGHWPQRNEQFRRTLTNECRQNTDERDDLHQYVDERVDEGDRSFLEQYVHLLGRGRAISDRLWTKPVTVQPSN